MTTHEQMEQAGVRSTHFNGKCCWKCESYDIHTRGCATHQITIHGDAVHVCGQFSLDRSRYATLTMQRWEIRGKAMQATLRDFRNHFQTS